MTGQFRSRSVRGLVADALRVKDDGRLVHIDLRLGHSARVSEPQRRILSDLASGLRARNVAVNTITSDDDRAPDPQMISALTAFAKFWFRSKPAKSPITFSCSAGIWRQSLRPPDCLSARPRSTSLSSAATFLSTTRVSFRGSRISSSAGIPACSWRARSSSASNSAPKATPSW
jgi:hypothetical protein